METAARFCVSSWAAVFLLVIGSTDIFASTRKVETPVIAMAVSESAVGVDLNGDGDTLDAVVHVFRSDGVTVNLALAAAITCRGIFFCGPAEPVVSGTTVAMVVGEGAQGASDLNGDGDTFDDVLFVYEAAKSRLIGTGLAAVHGIGRDISLYRFVVPPVILDNIVVFLVHEPAQGLTDLNSDGDVFDAVLFIVKPTSRKVVNLGLAAATVFGPFGSRNPLFAPTLDGHTLTVLVGELDQGEMDLNGNGIAFEHVPFDVHVPSGKVRPNDVSATSEPRPAKND
jgi:hypothetical protein